LGLGDAVSVLIAANPVGRLRLGNRDGLRGIILLVDIKFEFVDLLDEVVVLFVGELPDEGIGRVKDDIGDVLDGDGVVGFFGELVGELPFEEPGGGTPIAAVFGGVADVSEGFDLDGVFGGIELVAELGVAFGSAGDGSVVAADDSSGGAPTAAAGQHGNDLAAFVFVERRRSAGVVLLFLLVFVRVFGFAVWLVFGGFGHRVSFAVRSDTLA
jgi:hypothetical protein